MNLYQSIRIEGFAPNLALFFLRFYAGYTIMMAGLDKLPLPDWMTDQVVSMGFPFPVFFAWVASFSEFAFGALLAMGLMSRLSGMVLAFTMGVASFGFQKVTPLLEMHIAQHFFWIFVLFWAMGGGKIALDHYIAGKVKRSNAPVGVTGIVVFAFLLSFGLYRQFGTTPPPPPEADALSISSVNVPGSFNDWDPSSNEMQKLDDDNYQYDMDFEGPGLIEFKFTANKSWEVNLGELEQESTKGFPVSGKAELDQGNNTGNIKAYIPKEGRYRFTLNIQTYQYSLDSVALGN